MNRKELRRIAAEHSKQTLSKYPSGSDPDDLLFKAYLAGAMAMRDACAEIADKYKEANSKNTGSRVSTIQMANRNSGLIISKEILKLGEASEQD